MFRSEATINGKKKGIGVRFIRPDADTTICEFKMGEKTTHPKNMKAEFIGTSRRFGPDQFDKCRGHLISMAKAMDAANITNKKVRTAIYKDYAEWAKHNNINTRVNLCRIGE